MSVDSWWLRLLGKAGFRGRRSQGRVRHRVPFRPRAELLEDRSLPSAAWNGYAENPQHTALSTVASQALQTIHWQTPVDLNPQYSGNDLFIHYGSPVITASNTVIVPVKTGATGGFELRAVNGGTGASLWTQTTDYILPPHDWTPSFSPTLTPSNRLYFAGAGGTIYYINNPDTPGASTSGQLAFYGLSNYTANPTAYNNNVSINTPITADSAGNIYFGFMVTGSTPLGLSSGIARIAANGTGTWITASTAANDSGITKVVHNCAPALSNDGQTLYVAVSNGNGSDFGNGYLLRLNSTTLQRVDEVRLEDPEIPTNDAYLPDDGSASPMVGPDGDVYFGVLENNGQYASKGWMLHFSADLSQTKTPGAFGWDDTASVVPASLVPSYTGSSSYLLMTKYNNYADFGLDGVNKLAILDPNATEVDARTNTTVMKEVLTIAGVTPDTEFRNEGYPNAVREWCINTAVVDPFTRSVLANSEDGKLYRWDLTTNTFTQVVTLTPGVGEAYTPTVIGPDGTVYAINNATLFAVGQNTVIHLVVSSSGGATVGQPFAFTVTAVDQSNNLVAGYSGTVHFTSSDGLASLPSNSTLTGGMGTFSATLRTLGGQTLTATDTTTSSITGSGNITVTGPLTVSAFAVTPTGFTASFNKPFANSASQPINLYDAASSSYGPADVTLVGNTTGRVRGSLIINAGDTGFTFVKTGGPSGGTSGLLPPDTYTVTFVSGSRAFEDTNGVPLDGNNDGTVGDNYTHSFTVTASNAVVVTIPDLARGPDSVDPINVPNNSSNGIPIALSDGNGVTTGSFTLQYDATLLTISGAFPNSALSGASFTLDATSTAGNAILDFSSATALTAGPVQLGGLIATVPTNAAYKSKEVLQFGSVLLNGGNIPAVGDAGVHVVAFLGDASGDGTYTRADSTLLSRVAAGVDSGFAAFPVVDPVIIGDINGDGRINAAEAALLNRDVTGTTVAQIPPKRGAPSNDPAGPDPMLSLPANLRVDTGGTVSVPVTIDDPRPVGSTGLTQAVLALTYDPHVFSVSAADIHLGTVPASGSGWQLWAVVDATAGQIAITLFSATPIDTSAGGSLVVIAFHLRPGAAPGTTAIHLVPTVDPNNQGVSQTALDDDQGPLSLHLTPADAVTDVQIGHLRHHNRR